MPKKHIRVLYDCTVDGLAYYSSDVVEMPSVMADLLVTHGIADDHPSAVAYGLTQAPIKIHPADTQDPESPTSRMVALVKKPVADIVAALPGLSLDEIETLMHIEAEDGKVRKSLAKAIDDERMKRNGA